MAPCPPFTDNNTASIHCQTSCSFGQDDRHMALFDATVWGQFLKVVCWATDRVCKSLPDVSVSDDRHVCKNDLVAWILFLEVLPTHGLACICWHHWKGGKEQNQNEKIKRKTQKITNTQVLPTHRLGCICWQQWKEGEEKEPERKKIKIIKSEECDHKYKKKCEIRCLVHLHLLKQCKRVKIGQDGKWAGRSRMPAKWIVASRAREGGFCRETPETWRRGGFTSVASCNLHLPCKAPYENGPLLY